MIINNRSILFFCLLSSFFSVNGSKTLTKTKEKKNYKDYQLTLTRKLYHDYFCYLPDVNVNTIDCFIVPNGNNKDKDQCRLEKNLNTKEFRFLKDFHISKNSKCTYKTIIVSKDIDEIAKKFPLIEDIIKKGFDFFEFFIEKDKTNHDSNHSDSEINKINYLDLEKVKALIDISYCKCSLNYSFHKTLPFTSIFNRYYLKKPIINKYRFNKYGLKGPIIRAIFTTKNNSKGDITKFCCEKHIDPEINIDYTIDEMNKFTVQDSPPKKQKKIFTILKKKINELQENIKACVNFDNIET